MKLRKRDNTWNGFRDFPESMRELMRTPFERMFPDIVEDDTLVSTWAPAVDIDEEDNRYVVTADLPGVDPNDVEITLDDEIMTIRGRREESREEAKQGYTRKERFSGEFYRRFALPDATDSDNVTARSKKGVVEIVVPKAKERKRRRIEVKAE